MAKKATTAVKPDVLLDSEVLAKSDGSLIELMGLFDIDSFIDADGYRWSKRIYYVSGNRIIQATVDPENPVTYKRKYTPGAKANTENWEVPLVYVADNGTCWETSLFISLCDVDKGTSYRVEKATVDKITLNNWIQSKGLRFAQIEHLVNSNMPSMVSKYAAAFVEDYLAGHTINCVKPYYAMLYVAPQIEQLSKAGYVVADEMMRCASSVYSSRDSKNPEFSAFERTFKNGSNPKKIFTLPKIAYTALKDETDVRLWDSLRKMVRTGKLQAEDVRYVYESGYTDKELNQCNEILAKKFHGEPIFTWRTLSEYLDRLDMYEAISRYEAFQLLSNYLRMCIQADVKPNINSDSLKREHDVMARLVYQGCNEEDKKAMEGKCGFLEINNYQEETFFIRGVRDYDDLYQEAAQQRNGIIFSAKSIAAGKTWLYVMRETRNPDKSLVTVVLAPDGKTIYSQYMAYRRPVRSKAQKDFLKRWLKWVNSGRPDTSSMSV